MLLRLFLYYLAVFSRTKDFVKRFEVIPYGPLIKPYDPWEIQNGTLSFEK